MAGYGSSARDGLRLRLSDPSPGAGLSAALGTLQNELPEQGPAAGSDSDDDSLPNRNSLSSVMPVSCTHVYPLSTSIEKSIKLREDNNEKKLIQQLIASFVCLCNHLSQFTHINEIFIYVDFFYSILKFCT